MRARRGRLPLTSSGVYYLPFAEPDGPLGAGTVALHVADGSEIVSQRVGGPALEVSVGGAPYGACLARLTPARLADGWLPILETRYAGYMQESFAARIPQTASLVSFVRVTGPGEIRLTPTVRGLHRSGNRLVRGARTYLVFGGAARWTGSSLVFRGTAYGAWLVPAAPSHAWTLDPASYRDARASVGAYWRARLAPGASIEVPERRVMDAQRALLVQNLALSWRYSIGNAYEEASFPESLDQAQVMAELGFAAVGDAIVRVAITRRETPYPGWTMGEKLLAAAVCDRLSDDHRFLAARHARARRLRERPRGTAASERPARSPSSSPRTSRPRSTAFTRRQSPGRGCSRSRRPGGTPGTRGTPGGPSVSPPAWRRRSGGPWPARSGDSATHRSSCR